MADEMGPLIIVMKSDGSFGVESGRERLDLALRMVARDASPYKSCLWIPARNQHGEEITVIVANQVLAKPIVTLLLHERGFIS